MILTCDESWKSLTTLLTCDSKIVIHGNYIALFFMSLYREHLSRYKFNFTCPSITLSTHSFRAWFFPKILHLPAFENDVFFKYTIYIWFRRKLCLNPLVQLTILLAIRCGIYWALLLFQYTIKKTSQPSMRLILHTGRFSTQRASNTEYPLGGFLCAVWSEADAGLQTTHIPSTEANER